MKKLIEMVFGTTKLDVAEFSQSLESAANQNEYLTHNLPGFENIQGIHSMRVSTGPNNVYLGLVFDGAVPAQSVLESMNFQKVNGIGHGQTRIDGKDYLETASQFHYDSKKLTSGTFVIDICQITEKKSGVSMYGMKN